MVGILVMVIQAAHYYLKIMQVEIMFNWGSSALALQFVEMAADQQFMLMLNTLLFVIGLEKSLEYNKLFFNDCYLN